MKVKFTAECEIPDSADNNDQVKDHINSELDDALCCLKNELPSKSTIENLSVESAEIIPDTDPHCPKCNSKDVVVTMAATKDNMEYHCYNCGYDFYCRELKK